MADVAEFAGMPVQEVAKILTDRVKSGQLTGLEMADMISKYSQAYNEDGSPKAGAAPKPAPPASTNAGMADRRTEASQRAFNAAEANKAKPEPKPAPEAAPAQPAPKPAPEAASSSLDRSRFGLNDKAPPKPAPKSAQEAGWSGKQTGENVKTITDDGGWEYEQRFDATTGEVSYVIIKAPDSNKSAVGMVLKEGDRFFKPINDYAIAKVGDPTKTGTRTENLTEGSAEHAAKAITDSRPKVEVSDDTSNKVTPTPGPSKPAMTAAPKAPEPTEEEEKPKTLRERTSQIIASVMKRKEGDSAVAQK